MSGLEIEKERIIEMAVCVTDSQLTKIAQVRYGTLKFPYVAKGTLTFPYVANIINFQTQTYTEYIG